MIEHHQKAILIFGGLSNGYLKTDGLTMKNVNQDTSVQEAYTQMVQRYLKLGYHIVQLLPFSAFPNDPVQALKNHKQGKKSEKSIADMKKELREIGSYSIQHHKKATANALTFFSSIKHPNFHLIDPSEVFCNTLVSDKCVGNDGENLLFVDGAHPAKGGSLLFSEQITRYLLKNKVIGNPL